jgi:hypothetical protein
MLGGIVVLLATTAFVGALLEVPAVSAPTGLLAGCGGIALGLYVRRHPLQP